MENKLLLFVLFMLISCSSNDQEEAYNNFHAFLDELPEKQAIKANFFQEEAPIVYGPLRMEIDQHEQVVIVDSETWKIYMFSDTGELKTEAGGYGNGPGEFIVINDLFISFDNQLYVLDGRSQRVTSYDISLGQLNLLGTYNLPGYLPLTIESFYKSERYGYIGVFRNLRKIEGSASKDEDPFIVYNLDDELKPGERLLELKGNETIDIDGFVDDNHLGVQTHWHFDPDSDSFYYSHSDELMYFGTDFQPTGKTSGGLKEYPEYKLTETDYNFLLEYLDNVIHLYPEIKEALDDMNEIPYFRDFYVTEEFVFWNVFYTSWDYQYILGFNRHTEQIISLKLTPSTPKSFGIEIFGVANNKIYGIEYSDDGNIVFTVEFE